MTDHIFDIGYVIIAFLCVFPFQMAILKFIEQDDPDTFDHFMAGFLGTILAVFWPIILAIYVVNWLSKKVWINWFGQKDEHDD